MTTYCYQKPDKTIIHWRSNKKQLDTECLLNGIDTSKCRLIETDKEPAEAFDGHFYLERDLPETPTEELNRRQREKRREMYRDLMDDLVIECVRKQLIGFLSEQENEELKQKITTLSAEIRQKYPLF